MAKICRECVGEGTLPQLIAAGRAERGDTVCDCKKPYDENCTRPYCTLSEEYYGEKQRCCCANATSLSYRVDHCDAWINKLMELE